MIAAYYDAATIHTLTAHINYRCHASTFRRKHNFSASPIINLLKAMWGLIGQRRLHLSG